MLNLGSKVKSVKERFYQNKAVVVGTTMALTLGTAVVTHADGVADTDVTGAFTTLAGNAVATIKGVAIIGVGIMTVFLLWKYGKKIFNKVAN